jgi:hypothetical protein
MTARTARELEAALEAIVDQALDNAVAPVVKSQEQESEEIRVYQAYKPRVYIRRRERGGLQDERNMPHTVAGGLLTVRNEAPFDDGGGSGLDELVEFGAPPYRAPWAKPRRFTAEALRSLSQGKGHVAALRKALLDVDGIS